MPLNSEITVAGPSTPTGYTPPSTTISTTGFREVPFTSVIATSAVDDPSSAVTGLTALVTAVKNDLDTNFIAGSELGIDTTAFDVDAVAFIRNITLQKPNGFYRAGANYVVTGTLKYDVS